MTHPRTECTRIESMAPINVRFTKPTFRTARGEL